MKKRQKYQIPGARTAGCFLWVFLGVLVALGVWVWWDFRQARPNEPKPASQPARTPILRMTKPSILRGDSNNIPAQPTPVSPSPPAISTATNKPAPVARPANPVTNASAQILVLTNYPRPVQNILEAQVALARLHFSPGSIDGVFGQQTHQALKAWQESVGLPAGGDLDEGTRGKLILDSSPWTTNQVTSSDLSRIQPLSASWTGKAQQTALDYESLVEMYAERAQASPKLLKRVNPRIDWQAVTQGTPICIPNVAEMIAGEKAAFAIIRLQERTLQVFGTQSNLLAHFPCSIARKVEKRPVGELKVAVLAPGPDYTFDPAVFPESAEARQLNAKMVLPPGPNNPVGTAWIGLDRPGYGIHGTPSPEQVGRTESHGCFRLANWNAEWFLKLAWIGMPVYVLE